MKKRYFSPDQITDEEIIDAYKSADTIRFSARRNNYVIYRSIAFGELGWWLSLTRVLPLVGVTPQMLRPVFKRFDFGEQLHSYHQLGSFPLTAEAFKKLAKVLGKSIEVLREEPDTMEHIHLFTAHPTGEVVFVDLH